LNNKNLWLWIFEISPIKPTSFCAKLRHSIRVMSEELLSSSDLEEAL